MNKHLPRTHYVLFASAFLLLRLHWHILDMDRKLLALLALDLVANRSLHLYLSTFLPFYLSTSSPLALLPGFARYEFCVHVNIFPIHHFHFIDLFSIPVVRWLLHPSLPFLRSSCRLSGHFTSLLLYLLWLLL